MAFTGYDNETELFDDPTIGQVVFNHYKWGENADGSYSSGRYPIKSHSCTRAELGLEGDPVESKFLPINERFKSTVSLYQKKFLCLDKEDLVMFGDWNS